MTHFQFRIRPRFLIALPLTFAFVITVVVVLVIIDSAVPGGLPFNPMTMAAPIAAGGVVGFMTSIASKRELWVGEGWLILTDGTRELERVLLTDLAQARVYAKGGRVLEVTDRMGRVRLQLTPYPYRSNPSVPDEVANVLMRLLPHLQNVTEKKPFPKLRTERVLTFPPMGRPH